MIVNSGQIESTQPASLRQDFNDPSRVEKYSIPDEIYEKRQDSVLTWKKTNKLGRFDPSAADKVAAVIEHHEREAIARGLEVGRRCRVGGEGQWTHLRFSSTCNLSA